MKDQHIHHGYSGPGRCGHYIIDGAHYDGKVYWCGHCCPACVAKRTPPEPLPERAVETLGGEQSSLVFAPSEHLNQSPHDVEPGGAEMLRGGGE